MVFKYFSVELIRQKNRTVTSQFHTKYRGRIVAINIKGKIKQELETLPYHGNNEKLDSCSDKNSISTIFITVQMDSSINLALNSKIMEKLIHKNKY